MCKMGRKEKRILLLRLAAAGCPVDIPERPMGLKIMQKGEAHIRDMGGGYVAVVLYMALSGDQAGHIVVEELGDVFLPWGALDTTWLLSESSEHAPYKLPNGDSFEADSVLDHKLKEHGMKVRRGQCVNGYALGYAQSTIPQEYKHGSLLDAQFSVIDDEGEEYRGEVRILIGRIGGTIPRFACSTGLFECDEPIEESNGAGGQPDGRSRRASLSSGGSDASGGPRIGAQL